MAKKRKKDKKKHGRVPRNTVISGKLHTLIVCRVVDVNGEKILKRIKPDEEAQLKRDSSLNVFVTAYLPKAALRHLETLEDET